MTPLVLIVDDDEALADNLAEIVETLPCAPRTVSNGHEALAVAAAGDVAVALVDVRLPDGGGSELARRLRHEVPLVQVIMITGDATVESAIAAVGDGAFAFVLKPFDVPRLLDTVKQALARATLLRERARLQLELERSERRHREVVEAVPAFVLGLDAQGRIVLWNRRLEEITGFSRDVMLGRDGRQFVGEGPTAIPTSAGSEVLVRWERAAAEHDNPVTYAVGIDVTREQEMARRTLRAERLAAVGTLAAGLAHEIRNPLNAATLQLQLLTRRLDRGDSSAETVRSITQVVQSEIERLERLVNDFLAFARPHPLQVASMDLREVVGAVLSFLEPEAELRHVKVVCDTGELVPPVEGDRERLRQVLLNLARNAIEAMPDGGVLTVRVHASRDGVSLEVEDTGVGIENDSAIFDAFYTTKPQGTGLGLSLVHRIIGDHGGTIAVKSQPGSTRFTIWLPLAVVSPPSPRPRQPVPL
ncbi:MAG: ATP-binding protein [Deltaproteobacteria bacterium]|nr:ATP-binding protein [Deltaproteobacteria bacterium]